jgi:hypothetical protein
MRLAKIIAGLCLITALPCGFASVAHAQAWVKDKGTYFLKITGDYFYTEEEFNFKGDRQPIFAEDPSRLDTSFQSVTIRTYLEYGLLSKLTFVMDLPFKVLTSQETQAAGAGFPVRKVTRTNGGFSDLWASLRFPFVQGPSAVALQGGVKIPLGYESEPDNDGPPLGTGEVDGEIFAVFGQSFYPVNGFFQAAVGYRYRGGKFNDEYIYGAELGYTAGRLFMKFRFEGLQNTVTPPDIAGGTVMTPLPGGGGAVNNVIVGDKDEFKLLPTLAFFVTENFQITAEAYHVFAGKNTTAGTTYALGIIFMN